MMDRYVTSLKKTGKRPAREERVRRDPGLGRFWDSLQRFWEDLPP